MNKTGYITKQCRDMAHSGNIQAMVNIIKHYENYICTIAIRTMNAISTTQMEDYTNYTEDLIQEIKVNIIMNAHKFKE